MIKYEKSKTSLIIIIEAIICLILGILPFARITQNNRILLLITAPTIILTTYALINISKEGKPNLKNDIVKKISKTQIKNNIKTIESKMNNEYKIKSNNILRIIKIIIIIITSYIITTPFI